MRSVLLAAALLFGVSTAHAQPVTPGATAASPTAAPAPPRARPGLIVSLNTTSLVAALVRAGFTAEAKTENGQTFVIAKTGAQPFQAVLSNCQTPNIACTDIELFAGFTGGQRIAWERVNGWNARTRFARAFLDENRNPALQMDVSLQGGVSQDGLQTSLATWGSALETFSLFLVARVPPVGGVAAPAQPDPLRLPPPAQPKR